MREKSCVHLDSLESLVAVPQHPLGIRPSGNAYTAAENIKSAAGTFSRLPDELLVQVLEYLDGPCLRGLGASCKALFAFTRLEDLWKNLFLLYVSNPYSSPRSTAVKGVLETLSGVYGTSCESVCSSVISLDVRLVILAGIFIAKSIFYSITFATMNAIKSHFFQC